MQVLKTLLNIACNMQNMQNNMHDMQNMQMLFPICRICTAHFGDAEHRAELKSKQKLSLTGPNGLLIKQFRVSEFNNFQTAHSNAARTNRCFAVMKSDLLKSDLL